MFINSFNNNKNKLMLNINYIFLMENKYFLKQKL